MSYLGNSPGVNSQRTTSSDGTLNAQDVSGLSTIANTGSFSDLINKP